MYFINKKNIILSVRILILIALLYYLLFIIKIIDFNRLSIFLSINGIIFFFIIIIFVVCYLIISAIRQSILINIYSKNLKFYQSFVVVLIGLFYNNFLPSAYGGDLVRIYILNKHTNIGIAKTSFLLLLDRGFAFLGIIIMAIIALIYTNNILNIIELKNFYLIFMLLIIIFIIIAILLYNIKKLINMIPNKFLLKNKLIDFIESLSQIKYYKFRLFLSFFTSILSSVTIFASIAFIGYYLYGYETVFPYFITGPIIALLGVIPITPGNVGVVEALAEQVLLQYGIVGGATVYAIYRITYALISLIGGFFSLIGNNIIKSSEKH